MAINRRSFLAATATASTVALAPFMLSRPAIAAPGVDRGGASALGSDGDARLGPEETSTWMSRLSAQTPITMLTVPGTHNTAARFGGGLTECQTLTIPEQLASGIRYLDIRCRPLNGTFYIHHGPSYQNITFDEVLTQCRDFLSTHSQETILMQVQPEYTNASHAEFRGLVNKYLNKPGWRTWFHVSSIPPLLSTVRGKIVLVSNTPGAPGISWNGPYVDIQNEWTVKTIWEREDKLQKVIRHLERAAGSQSNKLFINFASGSSAGCWPNSVASYVNPRVEAHIISLRDRFTHRPPLGVVLMDFPEAFAPTLSETLIRWNTRL